MTHLDSSFLIDLSREISSERLGPAFDFIETLDEGEELGMSIHVLCELRAGAEFSKRPRFQHEALDQFLPNLQVRIPDEPFTRLYARLAAAMERSGTRTQVMDLLIATAAVLDDAPLVTNDVKGFARIPGLRTLSY